MVLMKLELSCKMLHYWNTFRPTKVGYLDEPNPFENANVHEQSMCFFQAFPIVGFEHGTSIFQTHKNDP